MFKNILGKKREIISKCGARQKYPMGTAFLLNEGLALESGPMEWGAAGALQLLMVFLEKGGNAKPRLVGEPLLFSATSLKRNQLLNVTLVPETVTSAGCNKPDGESPGLCLWRRLLHHLEVTPPVSLLTPRPPPVSGPSGPGSGPFSTSWWLSTVRRSLPSWGGHLNFQHRGKEGFGEECTNP